MGERDLELSIVRARPGGPSLVSAATVKDFRTRKAAEWGADVSAFLASAGEQKLAATVLLPRPATIVRTVALPGVAGKEIAGAIGLQIDMLHPWSDDEVAWGWMELGKGNALVGLVRKAVLDEYETLFAEAGIPHRGGHVFRGGDVCGSTSLEHRIGHVAGRIGRQSRAAWKCMGSPKPGRYTRRSFPDQWIVPWRLRRLSCGCARNIGAGRLRKF